MAYDVGDAYRLTYSLTDASGTPTNATVAVTVTRPDGTSDTATLTNPSTGSYVATGSCSQAGTWLFSFGATGALTDTHDGTFLVNPAIAASAYCSVSDLKRYLSITQTDTTDDEALEEAISTASREIDKHCNRVFTTATTATARVFYATRGARVDVDDLYTTSGLIVATDEGDDGTYETTWDAADYQLSPLNGIVDGETGWPYYRISAVESRLFPTIGARPCVQITAKWGWAAPPAGVRQAAKILAADIFKMATAPFGVAGYGDYGPLRVRDNPVASRLLAPYRRHPVLVGG